ncbi:MAG: toll/interleukin-1 receptor domain-containing protein [Chitinophagaceae bacterium]
MKSDLLLFISHASEDKPFVKDLADRLKIEGVDIWYDEYSLKLGDSLREKIDDGLKSCKYGLVILSPNFFKKKWTRKELDGLASKEIAGTNVILPIWHNVDFNEVFAFSPTLADRVSVQSSLPIEVVVSKILEGISFNKRMNYVPPTKGWEEEIQDLASVYMHLKNVLILSEHYSDKFILTPTIEIRYAFDHVMRAFEKQEKNPIEFLEAKEHLFRAAKDCYEIIILNRIAFIKSILKNYKVTTVAKILPEYFSNSINIIQTVSNKLSELRTNRKNDLTFIKEYENIFSDISVIADKINLNIPEFENYESKKPRSLFDIIFNKETNSL